MAPKTNTKSKKNTDKNINTITETSTVIETNNIISSETNTVAETTSTEAVKAKRGRKSKKDLMESLKMGPIIKDKDKDKNSITNGPIITPVNTIVSLNVAEIQDINSEQNILESNDTNDLEINEMEDNLVVVSYNPNIESTDEQKPASKKRGRKPKGGKIVQQVISNDSQQEEKTNVILHLKCSMKDLQTNNKNCCAIESYNFLGGKNDLTYEIIGGENINKINHYNNDKVISSNTNNLDHMYDNVDDDDDDNESTCKDGKEIWKKLKQLEHNLHINNVNNKRSACFWDTCEFDNPPIFIPKHFINGTYHVYGCFCSPECGVAYLMNENIDSSTKFERYHLFNHIYSKIYDYKKSIKPAPNPYYMLEKYYGNLSIQEYRSLLRNERLFLIIDKPLTRILPELHEDNDDFILNNKIIPSNNYHVKTRLQRKKQNKTSIVNEKFGVSNTNHATLES